LFMVEGERDLAMRIHLADDHTMFREGLASILASRSDVEVVGQSTTSGKDALSLISRKRPDVVITEIDRDLHTAEEVLSRIRSLSPNSKIIVLTMFDGLHHLKALSKLGIDACVHKSSSSEDLLATIATLSGDHDVKNVVMSMPRGLIERLGEEPAAALSERETEIVVLAARGLSNFQIARELHLSEATVKRHLANVYAKIGVGSRSEAIRMALVEQWIGIYEITSADSNGSGA
jgi:DNA-binding NarL/FixJ family response regulator